jgi:hypothetical protein
MEMTYHLTLLHLLAIWIRDLTTGHCLQFEVADFLFHQNQMSTGNINCMLNFWAASLAIHNDKPPFSNTTDLYRTIDSTPLGDVAWESFSL